MKKIIAYALLASSISTTSFAQPRDTFGGPDGAAQTIHHCGMLAVKGGRYTDSPTTTRIIERKLAAMGYTIATTDGVYGKADKKAVKKFQADYGLAQDGVVGPITAQRIAFASNPSPNVRKCSGVVDNRFL
jgi:murein L,D-transpeptidase YcbB/YkuD